MSGPVFRTLNLIDEFNCGTRAMEIDLSMPAERFIRVLDQGVVPAANDDSRGLWPGIRGRGLGGKGRAERCAAALHLEGGAHRAIACSSGSTGAFEKTSWIAACSKRWTRSGMSRGNGGSHTTRGARTMAWTIWPRWNIGEIMRHKAELATDRSSWRERYTSRTNAMHLLFTETTRHKLFETHPPAGKHVRELEESGA